MAFLNKQGDTYVVCSRSRKHAGKALEEVAKQDPSYLTWIFKEASADLDDSAFHHLEDVMTKHRIPFFPKKKPRK